MVEMSRFVRQFLYKEGLNYNDFELVRKTANDFIFKHKESGKVYEYRRWGVIND